ncbi:hypothetical protein ACL9RI_03525 [Janthinobacterium sp. Mn2066]|uniref:hypothetical protein n=1 Tax=Janthinobacterium sp. Mn2066 TaxID=3395264 RepID=UPI003BB9FD12
MKRLAPALFCACLLLGGAASAATAASSSTETQFRHIYSAEWAWRQAQDSDDDASLPHVDPATQEARRAYWADVLARLDALDVASLGEEERINYAV